MILSTTCGRNRWAGLVRSDLDARLVNSPGIATKLGHQRECQWRIHGSSLVIRGWARTKHGFQPLLGQRCGLLAVRPYGRDVVGGCIFRPSLDSLAVPAIRAVESIIASQICMSPRPLWDACLGLESSVKYAVAVSRGLAHADGWSASLHCFLLAIPEFRLGVRDVAVHSLHACRG